MESYGGQTGCGVFVCSTADYRIWVEAVLADLQLDRAIDVDTIMSFDFGIFENDTNTQVALYGDQRLAITNHDFVSSKEEETSRKLPKRITQWKPFRLRGSHGWAFFEKFKALLDDLNGKSLRKAGQIIPNAPLRCFRWVYDLEPELANFKEFVNDAFGKYEKTFHTMVLSIPISPKVGATHFGHFESRIRAELNKFQQKMNYQRFMVMCPIQTTPSNGNSLEIRVVLVFQDQSEMESQISTPTYSELRRSLVQVTEKDLNREDALEYYRGRFAIACESFVEHQ